MEKMDVDEAKAPVSPKKDKKEAKEKEAEIVGVSLRFIFLMYNVSVGRGQEDAGRFEHVGSTPFRVGHQLV